MINGQQQILAQVQPKTSMVINHDWSMVELLFVVENSEGNIQFVLEGKDWNNRKMYLDDVFIYSIDNTYYRIDDREGDMVNEFFMNNHQVREKY